jgi:repressor of nif and glnA expression
MPNDSRVGKDDRIEMTRRLLVESGQAMPTQVIVRNLKRRGATFERSTVQRYLRELVERGEVVKIDKAALDDRRVVEVDIGTEGYWIAADAL